MRTAWQPSANNQSWRPNVDYYPDTLALLPGDVLLFQPLKPGVKQRISQSFQKSVFTHAAIYVGFDHEICEATPTGGVAIASLEDSLPGNCLLVRRVPDLTPDDRNRIAIEAGQLRGTPYAFRQIFQLAWNRYLKHDPNTSEDLRHGVICSTLCEHALLEGTRGEICLRVDSRDVITPARLAATEALVDIPLIWTQVAKS